MVLSRSRGIDLYSGDVLPAALAGVDAVIDVTQPDTIDQGPATDFYTTVAGMLQRVGADQGVSHIVVLSIVGIEKTSFGYYQAKLAHEQAASTGSVPATTLRATQLHEFPAQLIQMTRHDATAHVFDVQTQPVAARTVADLLVQTGVSQPLGREPDVAGPQQASLVDLARKFVDDFHAATSPSRPTRRLPPRSPPAPCYPSIRHKSPAPRSRSG